MRDAALAKSVPVHRLGVGTILAYGFLFYAFAPLKPYISAASGLSEALILTLISVAMLLQAFAMPAIGYACDRFGALRVMSFGFLLGAIGIALLGPTALAVTMIAPWLYVGACFCLISLGLGMSAYEVAFSAAVQIDEVHARKKISIITFYGGIASSLSWLALLPLLSTTGLMASTSLVSALLLAASSIAYKMSAPYQPDRGAKKEAMAPFHWHLLQPAEKKSLICLTVSSGCEYLLFSATTLLLITWFSMQFDNVALAVLLASIYGPFQVVGRLIEMKLGAHLDARITGLMANMLMPISLLLMQVPSVSFAILAMIFFGIGNGILTVSYGFVTNLYFNAQIYARAKGWMASSRALGMALGPSLGGWLFVSYQANFMNVMIGFSLAASLSFSLLLWLRPTNQIHI